MAISALHPGLSVLAATFRAMPSHHQVQAQLAASVRGRTRIPFRTRRLIKVTVERVRHEREVRDRLRTDHRLTNSGNGAQALVLECIRALLEHVRDGSELRCRRRRLRCGTCKQLAYLCSAFMDSSTRSPNTAFARRLLGWVALGILWTFTIVQVSGMLPAAGEQGIASGTLPVAIAAALFTAAFVAVAQFLKEITERVPDYPPGLPLWFDAGRRVRERRLSNLQFRACEVLTPRRPVGLHHVRRVAASPRPCTPLGLGRRGVGIDAHGAAGGRDGGVGGPASGAGFHAAV